MKKGFPASSLYTNKFPDAAWVHRQKSDQSGLKGGVVVPEVGPKMWPSKK